MKMQAIILTVAGMLFACSVQAVDGFVRQGDLGGWNWSETKYWTDAAGQPLGTYPHEAGDTASLACVSNALRTGVFGPQASFTSFALSKLTGGALTYLNFVSTTKAKYPAQRLVIDDPDDFAGWWGTQNDLGRAEIVLNATADHSPKLSAMSVTGRNGLSVPAGTTASVGALFGDGMLFSAGAGTLKIGLAPGGDSNLIATNGTVEIAGVPSEDAESLIKTAVFRVDASRLDTMTFGSKEGDDHQYVIRWNDANGGAIYAYTNKQDYVGEGRIATWDPPFVAEETSPTGLRLIDFGDNLTWDTTHAAGRPVNGWLRISTRINAREVFYVSQTISADAIGGTVAGSVTSACSFRGGLNNSQNTPHVFEVIDHGDLRVNDQRTSWANHWKTKYGSDSRGLSVTSLSVRDDDAETTGDVSLIGSYAWLASSTANIRLGEMIVFTNRLTAAERSLVNRHLMKKWLKDATEEDFGNALLGSAQTDAAVSVPADRTVKFGEVTVNGSALVKEGAGTLKVGKLMPLDAAIDIRGGSVELGAPKTVADTAPAANPSFWLDAEVAASVVTQRITNVAHYAGDETMYVTRWNDCRPDHTSIHAEVPPESTWGKIWTFDYSTPVNKAWFTTNYPKYTSFGGHPVVDFGHGSDANNPRPSFMWINFDGTVTAPGVPVSTAYDAFIVFKWKAANLANNHFGSSSTDLLRASYSQLLDPANSSSAIAAGVCLYDGRTVDPWQTGVTAYGDATEFHVLSYSCAAKMAPDMLAKDRLRTPASTGQMLIGEYILYDRRLTRAEREQTTAYLLKKWRNEALPGSAADQKPSRALTFAATIPAEIGIASDTTVPLLSGGNGTLVKNGEGAADVVTLDDLSKVTSVTVNGGRLVLPRWKGGIASKMIFNFDATDTGSFETNLVGGTTRITRWFDERDSRQDIYAISVIDNLSLSYIDSVGDKRNLPQRPGQYYRMAAAEHPALKTVETADGLSRQIVDFGAYGNKDGAPAGAAMDFLNRFTNVAEIHTVMADTDVNKRAQIVSDYDGTALMRYPYVNATVNGQLLHSTTSAEAARNGYIAVDGEEKAYDYVLPDGFHLISFAPTAAVSVGNLCNERMFFCGGAQYGQQIAFSSALTADERAYLEGYLLYKWKGIGENPTLLALTDLMVAEGAEFDLGDRAIEVGELAGGGTVKASVRGVSAITVDSLASPLVVDGALELADGTVTVTLVEDVSELAVGSYTLVSAGSIDDSGVTEFEVVGNLKPTRSYTCRVVGNDLVLTVEKRGMAIIVR